MFRELFVNIVSFNGLALNCCVLGRNLLLMIVGQFVCCLCWFCLRFWYSVCLDVLALIACASFMLGLLNSVTSLVLVICSGELFVYLIICFICLLIVIGFAFDCLLVNAIYGVYVLVVCCLLFVLICCFEFLVVVLCCFLDLDLV